MANRPIFLPIPSASSLIRTVGIEFKWHPGMAATQKQKSIRSLHASAISSNLVKRPLEISSKSEVELGKRLSAFNLSFRHSDWPYGSVETAFQGSKVFEFGGPYTDLYTATARAAKKDGRIRNSGKLITFRLDREDWPLQPLTLFYDWLYLNALSQNGDLIEQITDFDGFTDIEFNPKKSINCQAASASLLVSLKSRGQLDDALRSPVAYRSLVVIDDAASAPLQGTLL
jgi:hypothetical protein